MTGCLHLLVLAPVGRVTSHGCRPPADPYSHRPVRSGGLVSPQRGRPFGASLRLEPCAHWRRRASHRKSRTSPAFARVCARFAGSGATAFGGVSGSYGPRSVPKSAAAVRPAVPRIRRVSAHVSISGNSKHFRLAVCRTSQCMCRRLPSQTGPSSPLRDGLRHGQQGRRDA